MTRPLFVFRPEPGWGATAEAARELGLEIDGAPLFAIEPVPWEAPDPAAFDGLLLGSANALRHGGEQLDAFARLPVHAVGQTTASAAREAGFEIASVGEANLQSLLDRLSGQELRLLRIAGEAHVSVTPPAGITIVVRTVYRARLIPIGEPLANRLRRGGVAMFHSGQAATALRDECERLNIDPGALTLAALFPRIAERAGNGWESVHIAEAPNDRALLALAQALCQSPAGERLRHRAQIRGRGTDGND